MVLGSSQPLTEMSTRNISWGGKGGRCLGLTTLPPSCAECHEIWEPYTSWNPQAGTGIVLPLYLRTHMQQTKKCLVTVYTTINLLSDDGPIKLNFLKI